MESNVNRFDLLRNGQFSLQRQLRVCTESCLLLKKKVQPENSLRFLRTNTTCKNEEESSFLFHIFATRPRTFSLHISTGTRSPSRRVKYWPLGGVALLGLRISFQDVPTHCSYVYKILSNGDHLELCSLSDCKVFNCRNTSCNAPHCILFVTHIRSLSA